MAKSEEGAKSMLTPKMGVLVAILCLAGLGITAYAVLLPGPDLALETDVRAKVVRVFEHDRQAFTQGLAVEDGVLWEGTGKYGGSSLSCRELETGKILGKVPLDQRYFGEGVTVLGDRIYQLTWRERVCLVFDKATLKYQGYMSYAGEGWGLADDEQYLYLSDGSSTIKVFEPTKMKLIRRIAVKQGRRRVGDLNELEWVNGELWANVWYSDSIVRIDPKSGQVLGRIDCSHIYPAANRPDREHVLNGIAYDAKSGKVYITGKYWPKLYLVDVGLPKK